MSISSPPPPMETPTETSTESPMETPAAPNSNLGRWSQDQKHFFVLTCAGKPVYARYGDEEKVTQFVAIVQTIVSFFADSGDSLRSIRVGQRSIGFLHRDPLILVVVSPFGESEKQLHEQLAIFNTHIISIFTTNQLKRMFERRINFDLRRLVFGSEAIFNSLANDITTKPGLTLSAIQCIRVDAAIRQQIGTILESMPRKFFSHVLLFARDKLLTVLRPRRQSLHPHDIYVLKNTARANSSYGTGEMWTPVCIPKSDPTAFAFSYITHLAPDLCLVVVSRDKEAFFDISEWKDEFYQQLLAERLLEKLKVVVEEGHYNTSDVAIPGLRHFIFKSKATLQYTAPDLLPSFMSDADRLFKGYQRLHHQLNAKIPSMIHYQATNTETVFGWSSNAFEIYATFAPFISKGSSVSTVNKLINWIQNEEESLFITKPPVF